MMCAHDEFRVGVPLIVRYVESGLQPNPLLTFCKESVVTRRTLALFHHCSNKIITVIYLNTSSSSLFENIMLKIQNDAYKIHGTLQLCQDRLYGSSHSRMSQELQTANIQLLAVPDDPEKEISIPNYA